LNSFVIGLGQVKMGGRDSLVVSASKVDPGQGGGVLVFDIDMDHKHYSLLKGVADAGYRLAAQQILFSSLFFFQCSPCYLYNLYYNQFTVEFVWKWLSINSVCV
jgi:hypothetical protein